MLNMYEFSIGAFFFGMLVLVGGALVIIFHQAIANNFLYGVGSYDKVKMWGMIICGVGIAIMANLHSFIFGFLFKSVFGGGL